MWYLLKTPIVVLVTKYVTAVMIAARIVAVRSRGLMIARK